MASCSQRLSVSETDAGTLFYHYEQLNASEADHICKSSNQGRLAILDSEQKFAFAIELAPQNVCPRNYYAVGLSKDDEKYIWVNGKAYGQNFTIRTLNIDDHCSTICPVHRRYAYQKPGTIFSSNCAQRRPFLCFKSKRDEVNQVPLEPFTSGSRQRVSTTGENAANTRQGSDASQFHVILFIAIALAIVLVALVVYLIYKKRKGKVKSPTTGADGSINHVYQEAAEYEAIPDDNTRRSTEDENTVAPYGVTSEQQLSYHETKRKSTSNNHDVCDEEKDQSTPESYQPSKDESVYYSAVPENVEAGNSVVYAEIRTTTDVYSVVNKRKTTTPD